MRVGDRLPALAALSGGRLERACAIALRVHTVSRAGSTPTAEQEILALARARTRAGPAVIAPILELPPRRSGKVLRRLGCSRLPRARARPARALRARSGRASSCTWTRRSSGASGDVGKRIRQRRRRAARRREAGSTCTSRSTTTPGSPRRASSLQERRSEDCAAFLRRARGLVHASTGITRRAGAHRQCQGLPLPCLARYLRSSSRIERRYTRPYSPWTNGKAEALIKTLLREWAYRFAYPTSSHRSRALPGYLRWYNRRRPHGSLDGRPPHQPRLTPLWSVQLAHVRRRGGGARPGRAARAPRRRARPAIVQFASRARCGRARRPGRAGVEPRDLVGDAVEPCEERLELPDGQVLAPFHHADRGDAQELVTSPQQAAPGSGASALERAAEPDAGGDADRVDATSSAAPRGRRRRTGVPRR